jgi:hypothetical protein
MGMNPIFMAFWCFAVAGLLVPASSFEVHGWRSHAV